MSLLFSYQHPSLLSVVSWFDFHISNWLAFSFDSLIQNMCYSQLMLHAPPMVCHMHGYSWVGFLPIVSKPQFAFRGCPMVKSWSRFLLPRLSMRIFLWSSVKLYSNSYALAYSSVKACYILATRSSDTSSSTFHRSRCLSRFSQCFPLSVSCSLFFWTAWINSQNIDLSSQHCHVLYQLNIFTTKLHALIILFTVLFHDISFIFTISIIEIEKKIEMKFLFQCVLLK